MKLISPDITIVEAFTPQTAPLVRRAIGFAGRLAADMGATVLTNASCFASEPVALQTFLLDGKEPTCPPTALAQTSAAITLLLTPAGDAWPNAQFGGVSVASVPGAGSESSMPVSDLSIQAHAGICELIGEPDQRPLKLGGHQAAFATGYAIYAALCSVLLKQQRFGGVERATVDALSVVSWVNWKAVLLGGLGQRLRREGLLAEWPLLPCADGHVAMVYSELDWPALIKLIGDPALTDERFATLKGRRAHRDEYQVLIARWVARHTKAALVTMFREARLPTAVVNTIDDLLVDPLLVHRQAFVPVLTTNGRQAVRPVAPYRAHLAGSGAPKPMPSPLPSYELRPEYEAAAPGHTDRRAAGLPLSGLRVLDLGIITAGAGTSALLADMGAQVMKTESSTYPDQFRYWTGDKDKDSPVFRHTNRNKQGLALDLKSSAGRTQFLELVGSCDIVLENFRRGVMERLGIGFSDLVKANPNILLVSLSGQGLTGPGAENASYGSAIEARSGIASITGYAGSAPVISGRNLNYPDQITCLVGAAAVLAALHWQQHHVGALHLDVSQRDLSIFTLGDRIVAASLRAGSAASEVCAGPSDNWAADAEPEFVLQDVYLTRDGRWLAVSLTPHCVEKIRASLSISRAKALSGWIAAQDGALAQAGLRGLGVACALVLDGAQVFADPLVNQGPAIGRTAAGELSKGFPFQYQQTPMTIYRDSPAIGEHNDIILNGRQES